MARELRLAGELISDNSDCYVVAEIGCNHMGDLDIANEMFQRIKDCGANAVAKSIADTFRHE